MSKIVVDPEIDEKLEEETFTEPTALKDRLDIEEDPVSEPIQHQTNPSQLPPK